MKKIVYVKNSYNRKKQYAITTVLQEENGEYMVIKKAASNQALPHIDHIHQSQKWLSEEYGDAFYIPQSVLQGNSVQIEYIRGRRFDNLLDDLYQQGKYREAEEVITQMFQRMMQMKSKTAFHMTDAFVKYFGEAHLPEGLKAAKGIDIDCIFSNIICCNSGQYALIDYEWTFDFEIPFHYVMYRVLRDYYILGERRDWMPEKGYAHFGITDQEIDIYQQMELHFQKIIYSESSSYDQFKQRNRKQEFLYPEDFMFGKFNPQNDMMALYGGDMQEAYEAIHICSERAELNEKIADTIDSREQIRRTRLQIGVQLIDDIINEIGKEVGTNIFELLTKLSANNAKMQPIDYQCINAYSYMRGSGLQIFPALSGESESFDKKAVLVTHELTRTGAPIVLQDLAYVLRDHGYQVVFVSPKIGQLKDELIVNGISVVIDPYVFNSEDTRTISDVLAEEANVVWACTLVSYPFVVRQKRDVFWWLHEGKVSFEMYQGKLPMKLGDNVYVLYGGEYVKRQARLAGYEYSGDVLLYGVNDLGWRDKHKDSDLDQVKFICAASFIERKGQDILMKAMSYLSLDDICHSEFLMIGAQYDPVITSQITKISCVFPNVKLLEEVTREELFSLYEQSDCIISPSRDDPMPVVLTENMSLGNIVICSNGTGTSLLLADGVNGFVFENESEQQLAEKIHTVISMRKDLDAVRRESRKVYLKYFDRKIFEQNVLSLVGEKDE